MVKNDVNIQTNKNARQSGDTWLRRNRSPGFVRNLGFRHIIF